VKMHSSPAKDNMKEPFGEVAKPPRTINRISPDNEGGMSLKSVQECEDDVAKADLKATLEAEGINVEEENPNIFLPDEAKMNKDSKTTGMYEFAKDLYKSAGVTEPSEDNATRTQPAEAEILGTSAFADDPHQHAEIAVDKEWKTPKTTKKNKQPKNPCGQLSPIVAFKQVISKVTGAPPTSSGSASDSTVCNSPNQNSHSPDSSVRRQE